MSIYAAIDTNVVLSALLSKADDAATVRVMEAVYDRRIIPLLHPEILAEYREVLCRERFHLDGGTVDAVIDELSQLGITFSSVDTDEAFSDPDDAVFYAVVMEKRKAEDAYLVTGNLRHFPKKPFVLTPAEMMEVLEETEEEL